MAEILHQLRLVVYLIIYRVLYIPSGDRRISSIPFWWPNLPKLAAEGFVCSSGQRWVFLPIEN